MVSQEFTAPSPGFSLEQAASIAEERFGVSGSAKSLVSERDQNFLISAESGERFILKIANSAEGPEVVDLQIKALMHMARTDPSLPLPRVRPSLAGEQTTKVVDAEGRVHDARMMTFLDGDTFEEAQPDERVHFEIGRTLARLQAALRGFFHPAAGRHLIWDIPRLDDLSPMLESAHDPGQRALAERWLGHFRSDALTRLPGLRAQVCHNDLQGPNIVVSGGHLTGVIDFGDIVHTPIVCDLSVTLASMMWLADEPFDCGRQIMDGYLSEASLESEEIELLGDLSAGRMVANGLIAAWRADMHPENIEYILDGTEESWRLLALFDELGRDEVRRRFRAMCQPSHPSADDGALLQRRRAVLGTSLPLAYERPLHIVRGEGVWLYDTDGRAYLDAYNNVPVVGHCHPRVVDALTRQARLLNTNPRYLHEGIVELAERLTATMPEGLDTVLYVNSGSEANDTAWRLAREITGNRGAAITDFAYHGVTLASSDLSPEEWPQSHAPEDVALFPAYDTYRMSDDPVTQASAALTGAADGLARGLAMTLVDSSFASDGIFSPPAPNVAELVQATHEAGGLYVADEVQAGFGRTGRLWGFQQFGIEPDFVTLGKPMGNGHPVAAVVTRREIAEWFARSGTEFFSTFGGNTVSTAVALTVLDVIEDENIAGNAADVGAYLRTGLGELSDRHELIGDVRGAGLMIGVELVSDRDAKTPAGAATGKVINGLAQRGVLVGSTGRHRNVLKIRPPLVFSRENADQLIETLDEVLGEPS